MHQDRIQSQASPAPAVPGFTLGAVLGRGGFATVWEGVPAGEGLPVAIKVGHGAGAVLVERFRREAEAMEIIGAPAVPRLVAWGRTDTGRPYIVMERLFGETLEARLAAMTRPPALDWLARACDGVLAALARVHEKGLLHRDIKPANVFFASPDDRPVLLDIGLVKHISYSIGAGAAGAPPEVDHLTHTGVAVGTPEYMAPEQIRAERALGAQADLYAFGVMLYEMLTLQLPFAGARAAVEHGHLLLRPRRPGELAPVPKPLEDLVLACLAKDPARRPASAADLRAALAAACQSAPAPAPLRESAPPSSKLIAEGRHPVVVAIIDARGDIAPVVAAVTGRGGFVPRQRGARYVAVFSGADTEDPLRAALAAARELTGAYGARAALHFAEVTIRRRERGVPGAYGAAVDRPETWLPPEPWSGLFCTAAITRLLPKDPAPYETTVLEPTAESASSDIAPDAAMAAPLTGRGALVDALAASLTTAFESGHPALFTLLGDPGTGKTRLAAEAAALAERAHPAARVVHLQAVPPGAGERARLTTALLRAAGDTPGATPQGGPSLGHHDAVRAISDALRRRASEGPIAVILDDAQWADDAVLDALEYASLDASDCPLWVFVAAHPRLLDVRAGWGGRTRHAERATLAPLDPAPAAELAAHLLAPAEYPPAALLGNLARWSGGNPASLTEIVRALKRAGVVRRRPGAASYQVATAALETLPPSPSWQWLATRRLAALPPELAACLRLCAVLGAAFAREELEAVQAALEQAGGAGTTVDAGAGLRALAAEGLLTASAGERYAFSNALLHDAVYELIDPAQRAEVHRAALAYHRAYAGAGAPPDRIESLARHAAAAGEREEAAAAYLRLGDMAAARFRHVEADQHYSAALALLRQDDVHGRALALRGRGTARIYIDRARDAVTDLGEARALAASMGDDALVAELLLEEATALDWVREFELSAARTEEARAVIAALESPDLAARLLVAEGRTAWRQGRAAESIELLRRALTSVTDHPSRVIALLCLTWQLAEGNQLAEAEAGFQEVIALTTGAGDLSHLCVALINRYSLWEARGDLERAIEDLQRALMLAREIGSPHLERLGCFNVAELLYWVGRTEEAITLTQRGCLLSERFIDRPEGWGPIYLAMFYLDRGKHAEARQLVDDLCHSTPYDIFGDSDTAPRRHTILRVVQLVLDELEGQDGLGQQWDRLEDVAASQDVTGSGLLGVLYWRARMAMRAGRQGELEATMAKARTWLGRSPLWRQRFDALVTVREKCP